MDTEQLNTARTEEPSVPPEVRLPNLTDEIEAEDCYQEHQRALERGNVCVKERICCAARLGRYLDALVAGRDRGSRSETFGRYTGSERVLPEWATKQQKYRWSQIGKIDDDVRERYFSETEAAEDEVTTAGLLDYWTRYLEQQGNNTDDEGNTDEETHDDEDQDADETEDDPPPPPPRTIKLVLTAHQVKTFDANRKQVQAVALAAAVAEIERLMEERK
jgi:hypothetical protein